MQYVLMILHFSIIILGSLIQKEKYLNHNKFFFFFWLYFENIGGFKN